MVRGDVEAERLFDEQTTRAPHRPGLGETKLSTDNVSTLPKHGNARAYTLKRLNRERPDLYNQVLSDDLTPNKAAKE